MSVRSVLPYLAFLASLGALTDRVAAHSDVPEADVACTGSLLLNDDLAPRTAGGTDRKHRIVSARAEILDAAGSPVGTLYLDDRGDRYVGLTGAGGAAGAFGLATSLPAASASESPIALGRDVEIPGRFHLAACR